MTTSPNKQADGPSEAATFVVAISGPTRAGKSRLAKRFQDLLQCPNVGQDMFASWKKMQQYGDWEHLEVIDAPLFLKKVDERSANGVGEMQLPLVAVEGFQAFHSRIDPKQLCGQGLRVPADLEYPAGVGLEELAHLKIVLHGDKETVFARREAQDGTPRKYFDETMWPPHMEYMAKDVFGRPQLLAAAIHLDGCSGALPEAEREGADEHGLNLVLQLPKWEAKSGETADPRTDESFDTGSYDNRSLLLVSYVEFIRQRCQGDAGCEQQQVLKLAELFPVSRFEHIYQNEVVFKEHSSNSDSANVQREQQF